MSPLSKTFMALTLVLAAAYPAAGPGSGAWAQGPDPLDAVAPDGTGQDDLDGLDEELEGLDDVDGMGLGGDEGEGGVRLRSFKGFGQTLFRSYIFDRNQEKNDEQWLLDLQFEVDLDLGRGIGGYLRPRFRMDLLESDLVQAEPLEAYVSLRKERWDVLVGQFVENWGIADTFNPIDVLNRRDLSTDILDPLRLGELGGRLRAFLEGGNVIGEPGISLYVIPAFRRAEFPRSESRWSLSQPPFELNEDADITPRGEDRVFLAARGQSTLNTPIANADLQVVVARGPEHFPILEPRPRPTGAIDLVPIYYGVWTAGGGLRAVPNADGWSRATLKAEVVYKAPYRTSRGLDELPDRYTQYVFGLDWQFPKVLTAADQITATAEYMGEAGARDRTEDFRPFGSDVALRVFWEANDFSRTSLEVRGVVDAVSAELIAEAILERQLRFLHDDLKVRLAAQYFDPDRSEPGFLDFFPNNSNVSAALRFDY